MDIKLIKRWLLIFIFAGIAFSGYLTISSLIEETCPIGGACPLFLSYPACWFGLAIYLALLATFLLIVYNKIREIKGIKYMVAFSILGILFAGSLLIKEIIYKSPISICIIGLIMYILILFFSYKWLKNYKRG